jgi:L-ornithine N5-monooxygenase
MSGPRRSSLNRQEVEILAIGAGPGNLGLAVALEELAPEIARDTLIVEQYENVVWQRGMLLPWTQSQVSFLKDLVTLRNPRSKFSFINYLHSVGRLDEFVNLASFTPYRLEISGYLNWVGQELQHTQVEYGRQCVSVGLHPADNGHADRWLVRLADGGEIACRTLVIGAGRDPHIPPEFSVLPRQRVIHSTEFSMRLTEFDDDPPRRVVVVGGAQSAAEMLWAVHQRFRQTRCTMVMRSIGLNNYESSKFTNELYYPSFVDEFNSAGHEARDQLLREMHRTNYAGLAPGFLETLYREIYLERLTGTERLQMITMADVADAAMDADEVALTLVDRKTGKSRELRCDVVMLGTGFVKRMPKLVGDLAAAAALDEVEVTRNYRVDLPSWITADCYLQGVNEATHGIADSLLSLLAIRAEEIVTDLLARWRAKRLGEHPPTNSISRSPARFLAEEELWRSASSTRPT